MKDNICEHCGKRFYSSPLLEQAIPVLEELVVWSVWLFVFVWWLGFHVQNSGSRALAVIVGVVPPLWNLINFGLKKLPSVSKPKIFFSDKCPSCRQIGIDAGSPLGIELVNKWKTISPHEGYFRAITLRDCTVRAVKGDVQSMCALGRLYREGQTRDGKPDHKQAVEWYRKAADAGSAEAMRALGSIYELGIQGTLNPDPNEAQKWYAILAAAGDAEAKLRLREIGSSTQ
jgi:Sel1 repeat